MAQDFVGAGWAFPLRFGPTGGIALVDRDQEIVEAIRLILGTAPGERPMRPEFGCAIHELVFAPLDPTTAGRMAFLVRAALERWEPRVDVVAVEVLIDDDNRACAYIDVHYVVKGTNDPRNLVFPFYVIPEGSEQ